MDHTELRGREVAADILSDIGSATAQLSELGWPVKLVSITIGEMPEVELYVRNQRRTAGRVGIAFEQRNFPADVSRTELLGALQALNGDPRVTGIIIQRPIPDHLDIKDLQSTVHPLKDVEGMHPSSIGNIVYKNLALAPCTATAAVELLKRTGLKVEGLNAVVIGHSEIVGKPIAFLLMAEGATVTVCHHMTRNLAVHSRAADAVFVAVGKPHLVTESMIKPGAAVIDIGINQIVEEDGSTRTVGDVDYDAVKEIAGWITPVPGGVGPVTVAILMRNAVQAARQQQSYYADLFASDNQGLVGIKPVGET